MIINQTYKPVYQQAGRICTEILSQIRDRVAPGIYPLELDKLAWKLCDKYQVKPAFAQVSNNKGPYGFATCLSVNDTVLHGIPSGSQALQSGDVIKLDFGIIYKDLFTDMCVTVGVGRLSKNNKRLVETTKAAVLKAVDLAIEGNKTGDLGYAMQITAKKAGYNVLKDYIGHGIGKSLHESPPVPAYGLPKTGNILKEGMVLCIEAQVVAGSDQVITAPDGWTVKTKDGHKSAMFEYMVVVGKDKPLILTDTRDWPLIAG